jgi:hypothetical protein
MPPKKTARFIEPMLLLRTDALPKDADDWEYQLKLDGYRVIAFKTQTTSRNAVTAGPSNDSDGGNCKSSGPRLSAKPSV